MLRFLCLLLSLVIVVHGERNPPEPVGFKRSFISPNDVYVRKWSSTGMTGLDHHTPIDEVNPIDEVDLASKKTTKKRVDVEGDGTF
jgi:hypothetical protein